LRYSELENLAFLVGFDEVVAAVELIFYEGCTVLGSKTCRILFLSLLRIGRSDHLLPFLNRIFGLVTKEKHTALTTGEIIN
jgi:hypothetical protein